MEYCGICGEVHGEAYLCWRDPSKRSPVEQRVGAPEEDNLFVQLQKNLAKKEQPLIDETRLKTGQDWSVLGPQVVGAEK